MLLFVKKYAIRNIISTKKTLGVMFSCTLMGTVPGAQYVQRILLFNISLSIWNFRLLVRTQKALVTNIHYINKYRQIDIDIDDIDTDIDRQIQIIQMQIHQFNNIQFISTFSMIIGLSLDIQTKILLRTIIWGSKCKCKITTLHFMGVT